MPRNDGAITAAGIRKRTKRGKVSMEALRQRNLRDEETVRSKVIESAKKLGRGEEYRKCRIQIREAADHGQEYINYCFSRRAGPHNVVAAVTEALAAKLRKAGFKATTTWPRTVTDDMGDSAAPCRIDVTYGGVDISWGPGKEHNKPKDDRYW